MDYGLREQSKKNAISANFHGAAVLFNRELFKLEFRHEEFVFFD
jgi:hypothetical protein